MAPAVVADPPKLLTVEEYLALPDDGRRTELVKGEVIEMPPPSTTHGRVCFNVGFALEVYLRQHGLGRIVSNDSGVVTERDPDSLRGADICYFSYTLVPRGPMPDGYWPTPELVAEVRSPSDRNSAVLAKVGEYLAAGVRLVLVVRPERATVTVYSDDQPERSFGVGEDLTLPELFPDFRVPVRSLFE